MSHISCPEKALSEALLVDLSRQLAATIGAQPFHCATNAWRALIEFPDLFQTGGTLVEGWFVIETDHRVVMNEHVWCETSDGRIVDPSILLLVSETTSVWYFAGLTRTWAEAEALEGELFPQVRFDSRHGEDGLGHAGYRAARAAARRKVYTRALRAHPPKAMQFLTAQDLDENPMEVIALPMVEGESLNTSLSLTVARSLPATLGRCWYNAREALLRMPHPFFSSQYVEGWLVGQWADGIRITEHGWVRTPRLGIVDPTIVLEKNVPTHLEYLPGLQLSWSEIQAYTTGPLPLARQRHLGTPGYQESCRIALQKSEHLAWQTGLPLFPEPGVVTTFRVLGKTILTVEKVTWDFPVPSTPSARVSSLLQRREEGVEWR